MSRSRRDTRAPREKDPIPADGMGRRRVTMWDPIGGRIDFVEIFHEWVLRATTRVETKTFRETAVPYESPREVHAKIGTAKQRKSLKSL